MANRTKNQGERWVYNRNYEDSRQRKEEYNRNRDDDRWRNTNMHQGSWNRGGGRHEENYGLGDTSQGSANYGHVDHGRGSRFYGTGNYGGYFGSGVNDYDEDRYGNEPGSRYQGREQHFRENEDARNYGSGNYGDSNFQHRGNRSNYYGSGRSPQYGNSYNAGRNDDFYVPGANRYSGYNRQGQAEDWDNDRDWWDRTSDEVSSWFGDEEAGRRRDLDRMTGPHAGKGPKGYTRSDEKIKNEIEEKLYHDSFIDATDIEVSVKDGEVTLKGKVENKQSKRRAEDFAENITGVHDVSNQLKVNQPSGAFYAGSDNKIQKSNTTSGKTTGSLSEKDQKLDQSSDLVRKK